MFGLPTAKRVCRDDLKSPRSSRASSPAESTTLKYAASAFERAFSALDTFTAPDDDVSAVTNLEHTKDEGVGVGEEEEQEFEFRLFHSQPTQGSRQIKPSGKSQADHDNNGVQKLKIRMRSPTPTAPASGEGRFINPFRGWEYYFTDPELVIQTIGGNYSQQQSKQNTNDKQQRVPSKETFGDVAITGDQILASAASGPMSGCRLPWRVIHLPPTQSKKKPKETSSTSKLNVSGPEKPGHKGKPGKKRRIMLRKRSRAKEAAEEADKEKRNKRNREKKIKRRQKEREKKAATRAVEQPGSDQAMAEPVSET